MRVDNLGENWLETFSGTNAAPISLSAGGLKGTKRPATAIKEAQLGPPAPLWRRRVPCGDGAEMA